MNYKEIARRIFYPGYGLYKEMQRPKDKRNLLWTMSFSAQALFLITKLALTPPYVYHGIKTNEWNFINYVKENIIGIDETKESSKLEKTIEWEECKD